jgi:hypothetical protein
MTTLPTISQKSATDAEIDAAVAEFCAGYSKPFKTAWLKCGPFRLSFFEEGPEEAGLGEYSRMYKEDGTKIYCGKPHAALKSPQYLTDTKAVIALLEKHNWECWRHENGDYSVRLSQTSPITRSQGFTRAACFALLKASGKVSVSE